MALSLVGSAFAPPRSGSSSSHWCWPARSSDSGQADTGSFASFASGDKSLYETVGGNWDVQYQGKCRRASRLRSAVRHGSFRSRTRWYSCSAPLNGAGLPALAILAGGLWLVRKICQRR